MTSAEAIPGEKWQGEHQKNVYSTEHFLLGTSGEAGTASNLTLHNFPFIIISAPNNVIFLPKPSNSIDNIITNIPEIKDEYDVPELIRFDKEYYSEEKLETDLINKYITSPICDESDLYRNDHDYLGLPIIRQKTDTSRSNVVDHNYSMLERPACFYIDLRHFCNICHKDMANLFSFNSHMTIHTINNDVECKICERTFLTTTCLNNHIATSHTIVCEGCESEVPVVQKVAHSEANAQQRAMRGKRATEKKIGFCVYCMKGFRQMQTYEKHMARHGGG